MLVLNAGVNPGLLDTMTEMCVPPHALLPRSAAR